MASVGQFSAHLGSRHWWQIIGILITGCGYAIITRKQLFLGLFTPKRTSEHATSHSLQPEQRSGTTVSRLPTIVRLLRRECSFVVFFLLLFAMLVSAHIESRPTLWTAS
jgi:hypothetical protein